MRDQIEAATLVAGKVSAFGGGGLAVGGWLSANALAALIGALCAVVGVLIQRRYTVRKQAREEAQADRDAEFHVARMAALRDGRHDDQQQH